MKTTTMSVSGLYILVVNPRETGQSSMYREDLHRLQIQDMFMGSRQAFELG